MKKPVSLDQLVGEIEMDLEDTFTYLDVTTGEVFTLTREEIEPLKMNSRLKISQYGKERTFKGQFAYLRMNRRNMLTSR